MTVLLVLLTFVGFLLIDYFYSRKHGVVQVAIPDTRMKPVSPLQPSLVGGFKVPENLRYHPGHTWALNESPSLVRVGMDAFAAKLTGRLDRVTLPKRGQWIRQGQKICTLHRDGSAVDIVSPIEGSIADVNDALVQNPKTAWCDPYGEGWLVTCNLQMRRPTSATC
jgi:glycine cleavage system H protein